MMKGAISPTEIKLSAVAGTTAGLQLPAVDQSVDVAPVHTRIGTGDVVMLNGLDEILADRIYARHAYWADEIVWNHRFVDVISVNPVGDRMLDLTLFHHTREI